ncbi:FAD-dependent oxidoreductase [Streptomyces sp. SID4919]|uniref:NAD(P)/FAD-dependent oxidoreductase n=1 Tax=unclassified Streptomyces TaxID=2593676 RepID=UPI000823C294|nr:MULTISPECIES: NAD(P)/FAD-dependent oxidoreductase [unclassified Streptomyces]MYY13454.1 FAD-dependent oxidoreductase [Streptomyces sp. SID4919]SCK61396.1 Phytoene dehydrogenase-related protein [Streptomyces sp. AmelKG-E11A]
MRATHRSPDVLVVGAGLAGLVCAHDLLRSGLDVWVVEGSDGVGGRMRSDRHEGFVIDRGFQVLNTSYPQVRARLALRDLRLRPFTPGVLVHTERGRLRLGDPTREPRRLAGMLPGRLAPARDVLALGLMSARDMLGPVRALKRAEDRTTRTALAAAGFSERFVEEFFRPFLSGVFLEDELETSSRFFHLVWRSMLRGTLCLPAHGIGAVPARLDDALPTGTVLLETPVERLTDSGVLLVSGREIAARAVVVATGPAVAGALLPGLGVPPYRVVTTYFHVCGSSPLTEPTLLTDSRRRFLNTCVLSEVVPGYAPEGHRLVGTSVLGPDIPGRETLVRKALAEVYATDTGGWDLLTVRTVPQALPAMPPPQPLSRTTRLGAGRYVCGDHRATGSVQGAMASGARAARELLSDLGR